MDIAGVFKSVLPVLQTVAPTIATAIGGPVAGIAVKALTSVFGLSDDAPPEQVAAQIAGATPDQLLALKQADNEFKTRMAELGIDLERIAADDRKSARDMQAAVKSYIPGTLAFVVVGGFLLTVFGVLSGQFLILQDPLAAATGGTLIGYVSAKADQVIGFYFGSSASSARKDELLAASTPPKR